MNLLLYGLQRSGTNFLESLIVNNYFANFLNSNSDRKSPLQKHCRFYKEKHIVPDVLYNNSIFANNFKEFESLFNKIPKYYIIISKDPYSWLISYKKWSIKCNWKQVNHNYILEYNLFYNFFLKLAQESDKFIFIKYVDLIKNEKLTLQQIESKTNMIRKFKKHKFPIIPTKVQQSDLFTDEKRNYYINAKYMSELSSEDIQNTNNLIDYDVIHHLGYELKHTNI